MDTKKCSDLDRRSRILFLVCSMQGGGAERVAAMLCNHWVEHGCEVTLMPTFSGRGECMYPLDERVRLDYLADRVGSHSRSLFNKMRRFVVLRRAIRKIEPDVIVSFHPHVNVAAVFSSMGLEIPVVVSERTYPPVIPLSRGLDRLRRFAYSRATKVVVQTNKALAWLRMYCPKARGVVITNPIVYPLPKMAPVLEPTSVLGRDRLAVLAVGRLGEEKGFDKLIEAFGKVAERYPDWDLVILGGGEERERLERQRENIGLSNRIHLPDRVGNPGDWYSRAEFYVMSSRFEGFPNTLLEAMAYGLPVISFDCDTGPADIIREGVDGFLVPPAEGVDGLVRAMEILMRDKEKRLCMGSAAVDVRQRFAPEHVISDWNATLSLRGTDIDV